MSAIPEFDEQATMQESIERIHAEWDTLYNKSSSGQKARLTQIENHYERRGKIDQKASERELATHEYAFGRLQKEHPQLYRQVQDLLTDYLS